jgi:peroxiredoxin Q/BCP
MTSGEPAPAFILPDQDGQTHRLADYRGHWVVLYFYPRDDTPGCTREACAFRDDMPRLHTLDAVVLGVSTDATDRHQRFAARHGLPFPLLADTDGEVAHRYGALWRFGPWRFARRHTFLIDPTGRIARVYRKVRPTHHSAEVVRDLETWLSSQIPHANR